MLAADRHAEADALYERLRNFVRGLCLPRVDAAVLLRTLADELHPDVAADDRLMARAAFVAGELRESGHKVSDDLCIGMRAAARVLGISYGRLRNLRSDGDGPPSAKLNGRDVGYLIPDLLAWREYLSRSVTRRRVGTGVQSSTAMKEFR